MYIPTSPYIWIGAERSADEGWHGATPDHKASDATARHRGTNLLRGWILLSLLICLVSSEYLYGAAMPSKSTGRARGTGNSYRWSVVRLSEAERWKPRTTLSAFGRIRCHVFSQMRLLTALRVVMDVCMRHVTSLVPRENSDGHQLPLVFKPV
jgi:hypothetical protein